MTGGTRRFAIFFRGAEIGSAAGPDVVEVDEDSMGDDPVQLDPLPAGLAVERREHVLRQRNLDLGRRLAVDCDLAHEQRHVGRTTLREQAARVVAKRGLDGTVELRPEPAFDLAQGEWLEHDYHRSASIACNHLDTTFTLSYLNRQTCPGTDTSGPIAEE
jgi:hypothetical protein